MQQRMLCKLFICVLLFGNTVKIKSAGVIYWVSGLTIITGYTLYQWYTPSDLVADNQHNNHNQKEFEALQTRCLNAKNEQIDSDQRTDYLNYVTSYANHANPALAKKNNHIWRQAVLSCMHDADNQHAKEENASNLMECFYIADDLVERNK